jgi:hypothetical protein
LETFGSPNLPDILGAHLRFPLNIQSPDLNRKHQTNVGVSGNDIYPNKKIVNFIRRFITSSLQIKCPIFVVVGRHSSVLDHPFANMVSVQTLKSNKHEKLDDNSFFVLLAFRCNF